MAQAPGTTGSAADAFIFDLPGSGHALFSTRAIGNLSTAAGDGHDAGLRRREELCRMLKLDWLCASRQVHGTEVNRVLSRTGSGGAPAAIDADGHASAVSGVGTMVLAADCLPVALGCPGAVAMIHAGWRGLADGVLEEGVRAVRELGGEGELAAVIGPCAGVCCYEVGEEVHARFGETHRSGRNIDLRAIAHERLHAVGVGEVRDVDACTICDERFFSYRREGERAGRHAGVSWLS